MAVPKKKKSKSKRDMRRANHDRITAPSVSHCPKCGGAKLPHHVCPECGWYKDREVIAIEAATESSEILDAE
jgi:large subunit ribosomal protein L32